MKSNRPSVASIPAAITGQQADDAANEAASGRSLFHVMSSGSVSGIVHFVLILLMAFLTIVPLRR